MRQASQAPLNPQFYTSAGTGFAAADLSRIRNAEFGRFTADRLVAILNRFGWRVEAKIRVRPAQPAQVA